MSEVHTIMLGDQIPRFGCGIRRIVVVKSGPKWVTLGCGGKRHRMPTRKWLELMLSGIEFRQRMKKETA